jgi:hypothetical protein
MSEKKNDEGRHHAPTSLEFVTALRALEYDSASLAVVVELY